ncbi:bilirubin oxidase [Actinoplanes couchii]|uniref:Multicopper oxidase n=2 Tax=Actinoplanes couchii TaxID=403638 RepID=A0ABQ3XRU9_9ACTN|nr:multicopper oxidase domain-containing protein [Actinoplanes couchii]MDR6318482.1 bilirubin oxidase [Actinoplanes couchii]GID61239.1 multicopper oxidase [Actinoplanes couchii]
MDRRALLKLTVAGLGAGATALLSGCAEDSTAADGPQPGRDSAGDRNRLHVPPLVESSPGAGQPRTFDLIVQAGRSAIVPAGETDTWGYNGTQLGPTLRVRRGEQVRVNVRNTLGEATSVHWHGMHVPATADGGPHQSIDPGATWSPVWTVDQPAATLWYHPHPHGQTEAHVYRGLSGMLIVDDDDEARLALPRTYGVDDIPVIVQDKTFDETGRLIDTTHVGTGMLGDTILVNGTAGAQFTATSDRVRMRLLNASTARSYAFGFADDREFDLIATDGGLLAAPLRTARITLTPGERAEIIVSLTGGEQVMFRSYPQDLGASGAGTGADDMFDVLRLDAAAGLRSSPPTPDRLTRLDRLPASAARTTRRFEINLDRINDEKMDMSRVDQVVTMNTTEIWEVANTTRTPHNFHVHGVRFQILTIDGQDPPAELAGWKDTVYTPPGIPLRLIMRFTGSTDPVTPYMYHCHMLWHEDIGMMGQFVIVAPGEQAATIPTAEHQHD